jgi:hypothetical protein
MTARIGRALIATAAILAATIAGPVARADGYDPYGTFTDGDGVVWVTMSVAQYLEQPAVRQMQQVMLDVADHNFRAGDDVMTDDAPDPGWNVVRNGQVTRFITKDGRTRTIRYVGPDRAVVGEKADQVRVLIPESMLAGPTGDAVRRMRVTIKDTSLLQSIGLQGGPLRAFDYYATSTAVDTYFDESNGLSWNMGEFHLTTRGVPQLPTPVKRLVR